MKVKEAKEKAGKKEEKKIAQGAVKEKEAEHRPEAQKKERKQEPVPEQEPEQAQNQKPSIPEVNIGIVGHVDHGKTTLASVLTGKFTDEHSEELKRGITIRLGYADVTIRKCPKCAANLAYSSFPTCFYCGAKTEELRTVSFVDAPGHETLMATVLTGAALMDGAMLVIAANELCPQPQTAEHLEALNISGIRNIIIVQNKIDIVSVEEAKKSYDQIKAFVKGTVAENAPIIPVSAQHRANIGYLFEAIQEVMKTPERDGSKPARMLVARSFDVNKPGADACSLMGGILGGGLTQGTLSVGDEIEIRPGISVKDEWRPLKTKVYSVKQGKHEVSTGSPGGLLAISTGLDPYITKSDNVAGSIVGKPGQLPEMRSRLKLEVHLMKRVVGSKEEMAEMQELKPGDSLLMNVGTQKTVGLCAGPGKGAIEFALKRPVCADFGEKVVLSRQVSGRWRLIGYGIIRA